MKVVFNSVFALTFNVPELNAPVGAGRKDISSIRGNSAGEHFFFMAVLVESCSSLSGSEIPESHFLIPR